MLTMHPLDHSGNELGVFPCGRSETTWESKEFRVPETLNCDICVYSMEWKTEKGKQYYCADIEIIGGEVPDCYGQCLNGGICQNGACVCAAGFSGSNCQYSDNSAVKMEDLYILLIYLLWILLIIVLFAATFFLYKWIASKEAPVVRRDPDQLTSNTSVAPSRTSKYKKSSAQDFDY